jgi:mannosyltransferase
MLWTFSNKPLVTVVVLAVLGICLVQYFLHRPSHKTLLYSGFVVFWFWSIVLFMFGISYWVPIFMDRYVMPGAVAFPLLIGICADALVKKSWYRFMVPFMVCGLFMATVKPNSGNGRDIEAIVSKVKSLQTNRSMVFFCPDWFDLNFAYYYNRAYFMDYNEVHIKDNIRKHLHGDHVFPISHAVQISQQPLADVERIIYLDTGADFTYPNNGIRPYLAAHFKLHEQMLFDELFEVLVYEKK